MQRTLTLAAALLATCTTGLASDLFVGSPTTLFSRFNVTDGSFATLGACGGVISSMASDASVLYLGTNSGFIYATSLDGTLPPCNGIQVANDATALVSHGNWLFVGGSDGTVKRIDKPCGTAVTTWNVGAPVSELLVIGDKLYAGSSLGVVFRANLSDGVFSFFGTCGGPVTSMAADDTHLILGSGIAQFSSTVYRVNLLTQQIDSSFPMWSDATAMAVHGGQLFMGGSGGWVLRMNRETGSMIETFQFGAPISALSVDVTEPGNAFCFGSDCPCGNTDGLAGCANNNGTGAGLVARGSASIANDDLAFTLMGLPSSTVGRLYMGAVTNSIPFGDGKMCAGSGGYGLFRFPVQQTNLGAFSFGPGIGAFAATHFGPTGQLTPGFTWHFQGWYRNPAGPCGSGFNTTNGYSVTFAP